MFCLQVNWFRVVVDFNQKFELFHYNKAIL